MPHAHVSSHRRGENVGPQAHSPSALDQLISLPEPVTNDLQQHLQVRSAPGHSVPGQRLAATGRCTSPVSQGVEDACRDDKIGHLPHAAVLTLHRGSVASTSFSFAAGPQSVESLGLFRCQPVDIQRPGRGAMLRSFSRSCELGHTRETRSTLRMKERQRSALAAEAPGVKPV